MMAQRRKKCPSPHRPNIFSGRHWKLVVLIVHRWYGGSEEVWERPAQHVIPPAWGFLPKDNTASRRLSS